MKTSLATTHLLCLLGGFLLSNVQNKKGIHQIGGFHDNHHLIQIKSSQIPEKENLHQKDKISLTLSHQKQPWCVFDLPPTTVVYTHPLWVKTHSKNAISWLQKISSKTMIIPTRFAKNLPLCTDEKPTVKWS
ncbi:MAG: hypothetical protein AB8C84_02985 [Oligoflexales bacterium]